MAMGRRFQTRDRGPQIRVNHRIRVPEVRVVAEDGSNLGVLPTSDALRRAQEKGLDLVEVNPKASPPVCKILNFGKYKYEEKKKQREAKKKQTVVEVKEIKLRPKTDDHDLMVKARAARRFLEAGNKVKVICRFRGREITHPEIAKGQLDSIFANVEEFANIEQRPTMEGRTMALIMSPKPAVLQRLAQDKAARAEAIARAREAEREQADDDAADAAAHPDEDPDDDDDEDDDVDDEDDDVDDEDGDHDDEA